MRRICKILFWSLIISVLFCDTLMANVLSTMSTAPAVLNKTDMSMAYIGMVFGHVGSVVQGMSGEILGTVIYRFNQGVVIVAGILLSYTTVATVMRGSNESIMSSQNRSTALLVGRMALGFGLLLPIPHSNYNTMQIVLMKVVKESVSLADWTWSATLEYLDNGGFIFSNPVEKGKTPEQDAATNKDYLQPVVTNPVSPTAGSFSDYSLVSNIFINEVCMYQSQLMPHTDPGSNQDSSQIWNDAGSPNLHPFIQIDSAGNRTIIFPSSQDDKSGLECGRIDVGDYFGGLDSRLAESSDATNIKETVLPNLLMQTADSVGPAAKSYVCTLPKNKKKAFCAGMTAIDADQSHQQAANAFFDAYLNYTTGAIGLQRVANDPKSGADPTKNFIQQAKAEGWALAGSYYWRLTQFYDQANKDNGAPINFVGKKGVYPTVLSHCNSPQPGAESAVCQSVGFLTSTVGLTTTQIQQYAQKISPAANDSGKAANSNIADNNMSNWLATEGSSAGTSSVGGGSALMVASPFSIPEIVVWLAAIVHLIDIIANVASAGWGFNPIDFFYHLGIQCVDISADILFGTILAAVISSLLGILAEDFVNLNVGVHVFNQWMKPFILACCGMFLFAGLFCIFFVPFYAYFVYVFGVIGWIILVIESVVAMPIVALGLTHPDYHDMLGKSEQTMMLLLTLFIRPVCMTMGLVIGIILSMVGYIMVIKVFGLFLVNVAQQSFTGDLWGMLVTYLLVCPIMLLLFCSIIYNVTTLSYKIVLMLPDTISSWIGSPQSPDQGAEKSLRDVEGIASGGMQKSMSASTTLSDSSEGPSKDSSSKLSGSKPTGSAS